MQAEKGRLITCRAQPICAADHAVPPFSRYTEYVGAAAAACRQGFRDARKLIRMAFKLSVFIGIVIVVAVLGMRAYRSSVRGFEQRQAEARHG